MLLTFYTEFDAMKLNYLPILYQLSLVLAFLLMPLAGHAADMGHDHHQHDKPLDTISGEEDPHAQHKAMMKKPAGSAESTRVELLDHLLTDQDGRQAKLVSDIISDRIVVIDFIYTTCTTVCPVVSAIFSQLQDKLGDRLGKEVLLLSITVDAIRDTPQRLKAYAAKHKAKDGWLWLTGNKRSMDEVLDGMGAYTSNFEDHPAMVLVGDGRSGEWSRFFGFPSPDRIMKQVDKLQAARNVAMGDKHE